MYNRYEGNTGRYVRVEEPPPRTLAPFPGRTNLPAPGLPEPEPIKLPLIKPPPGGRGGSSSLFSLGAIQEKLEGILPKVLPDGLETEDLILMLILYLMYKESGDKEFLIILGAMFLL